MQQAIAGTSAVSHGAMEPHLFYKDWKIKYNTLLNKEQAFLTLQ